MRLGLVNNYDKFKYTAPSNLPRVRTFLREYLTTSALTMPNLQLTHVGKVSQNQYYSVYGGYLESMFAGVGAEWLYKRSDSRIAVGVDVNAVKQRNVPCSQVSSRSRYFACSTAEIWNSTKPSGPPSVC